ATALTIGLASLLTDRSGRIDTAAPLPELTAPPSLTLAMLRSSIRLSPGVNASVGDDALDAAETPYVENRESYSAVIREGTAPGPRDPNEVLEFGPVKVRRHIVETIVRAARVTNADPVLLMAIADKESSFSTGVKAKTSSATGLYQFIEKTWLKVVKDFGPKHGLEKEAKAIVWEDDTLVVRDEKERILDLRRDPYLSAVLAGEMLNRDRMRIARRIGRDLTHGETYLAHFLGPDGAERFMATLVSTPKASAAELLPKPAAANKPIFFTREGGTSKALTMAEVHEKFEAMMGKRLDRYRNVSRVATPMAFAPVEQPAFVLRIGQPAK
ncbi:MAG TPA: transglycosylase SLT domain-containing protein, partial [Beijerinckiaceae bacterium]|nr:transglycosylase SLT domain-containing protein [Beijerinckiaceae bacterium]